MKTLHHETIKIVTEHIDSFKFNTALAQLIIFVNEIYKQDTISIQAAKDFVLLLSPFAPHIAEELWYRFGETSLVVAASWPPYDPQFLIREDVTMVVQVNGKIRATIVVSTDISKSELESTALNLEQIKKYTEAKHIKKIIIVENKLVNIVI